MSEIFFLVFGVWCLVIGNEPSRLRWFIAELDCCSSIQVKTRLSLGLFVLRLSHFCICIAGHTH